MIFDSPVNLTNSPYLQVELSNRTGNALATGGDGSNTIDFVFEVQADDTDLDGIQILASLKEMVP